MPETVCNTLKCSVHSLHTPHTPAFTSEWILHLGVTQLMVFCIQILSIGEMPLVFIPNIAYFKISFLFLSNISLCEVSTFYLPIQPFDWHLFGFHFGAIMNKLL